jgi:hypothetical protein
LLFTPFLTLGIVNPLFCFIFYLITAARRFFLSDKDQQQRIALLFHKFPEMWKSFVRGVLGKINHVLY